MQATNTQHTFEPLISDDGIDKAERTHRSWQPIRRAATVILARSYDELAEPLVREDEDAINTMLYLTEQIGELLKWRASETEALEAAQARLLLVLSQEVERLEAAETRH